MGVYWENLKETVRYRFEDMNIQVPFYSELYPLASRVVAGSLALVALMLVTAGVVGALASDTAQKDAGGVTLTEQPVSSSASAPTPEPSPPETDTQAAPATSDKINSSLAIPDSQPEITPPSQTGCDSNYSPCVPISSSDLDCRDIGFSVRVIGTDIHGFDGDGDGYGCESY